MWQGTTETKLSFLELSSGFLGWSGTFKPCESERRRYHRLWTIVEIQAKVHSYGKAACKSLAKLRL